LVLGVVAPEGSGVTAIRANGEPGVGTKSSDGMVVLRLFGMRSAPVTVDIAFPAGKGEGVLAYEVSTFPDTPEARALLAARAADGMTMTVHSGDSAVVTTRVALGKQAP
jgi:hypothetical protein